MLRTHRCEELNKKLVGERVTLVGWADSVRAHGKIGFINLRDRYGIVQLFFKGSMVKDLEKLKRESVIEITGQVNARPDNLVNKDMPTGEIEIIVEKLTVLNPAEELPLELDESVQSTEETRLKYRYLDLRKPRMQKNIITRSKVIHSIRDFLVRESFLEIETPLLAKSTPEGARDYLVPSRKHPGKFFALPQSPQLFKQLLMVAGFDKYFQIAKCLRDEDLRADRQPEFTQLDIELSFITQDYIFDLIERMVKYVWKEVLDIDIEIPFPRMTYAEAMKKHKTDRPHIGKGKEGFHFLWVYEFPLLEHNDEENRLTAVHHPFTSPMDEDMKLLDQHPEKVRSKAYDLVLNGEEVAGGSIRIHDLKLQRKIFDILKIPKEEAEEKFKFLLDAFKYGAPPHGGIAFGMDRLIAIIVGEDSIREVIAFPKN
ncbi:MAG: aspartate--tRNA ligase, partial [archaeon]